MERENIKKRMHLVLNRMNEKKKSLPGYIVVEFKL